MDQLKPHSLNSDIKTGKKRLENQWRPQPKVITSILVLMKGETSARDSNTA